MTKIEDFDEDAYYRAHPELRPFGANDLPPRTDSHMATGANAEYFRMTNPKPTKQRRQPEKELEQFVHDTAKACGLLYYHTYRSRFSEPGFPDCIIIGKWMVVAELKDTGKNPTPAQQRWLDAFKVADVAVRVWHPEDRDCILQILMGMRP